VPEEYARRGLGRRSVSRQEVANEAYSLCQFAWHSAQERVRFEWVNAGPWKADQLDRFYRAMYSPSSLTLKIVGRLDPNALQESIERILGGIPAGERPQTMPAKKVLPRRVLLEMPPDFNRTFVILAYPCPASAREWKILSIWSYQIDRYIQNDALRKLSEGQFTSCFSPDLCTDPFFVGVAGARNAKVDAMEKQLLADMAGVIEDDYTSAVFRQALGHTDEQWKKSSTLGPFWTDLLSGQVDRGPLPLTLDELRSVVRRYLDPHRARIVVIRPRTQ
jgi:hypothetical protein